MNSSNKTMNLLSNETDESIEVQMPTCCLDDKQYLAKEFGALTLLGDKNSTERCRYLPKSKFHSKQLADTLGIGRTTLERNIKILETLKWNILRICNTKEGIEYKLYYDIAFNNKYANAYVNINREILREMVCNFNSNSIKVYCLLKQLCNETDFTPINNKYITEKIGLNSNSHGNLSSITKIIRDLESYGYISTQRTNTFVWDSNRKKTVPRASKQYRICTYEEWKGLDNKNKQETVSEEASTIEKPQVGDEIKITTTSGELVKGLATKITDKEIIVDSLSLGVCCISKANVLDVEHIK